MALHHHPPAKRKALKAKSGNVFGTRTKKLLDDVSKPGKRGGRIFAGRKRERNK